MTEQEIFVEAVEMTDPAARAAYLDRACGGDPALRQRVAVLMGALGRAGDFLQGAAAPDPEATRGFEAAGGPAEAVGTTIGPFKLLEPLGEGGMGAVFVAEQRHPVRRKVALKLIKPGMDSKAVLARFDAERQALAMMDHPNIAKVLDAGLHDNRPYFVMELIKGVPITEYCDANKLTPRQRLELFVPVCQAIQHAHMKGVIHRDIKPSNVLVALYDDKPVPKVIDFGVAKATGASLTDHSLATGHGTVVGTPEYMSPEQASFNNLDIDTRSDVYSLGVLLYELLTGSTPVDRKSLGKAALLEILRIVREVEAPRLSAKLSTIDTLPSVAANRGTEPAKLSKLMKGELDWVVLKALEKDRTRRYDTANGLARDIQRYLTDEIVEARPASTSYRLRKFVRRHKGQVIAASLVFCALVAGVVGTTLGLFEAKKQERVAVAAQVAEAERAEGERVAKDDALQAVAAARAANAQAQARLTQIEKGNTVLTSIFDDLDIHQMKEGTEPLEAVLAKRLVKAAEQLEGDAVGDPLVVAGLQNKLGATLMSLGFSPEAIPLLRKARETRASQLGADHPDTLESMGNLATGYQAAGKLDLALPLYEETLTLMKAKVGADHPDTLTTMSNLASGYKAAGKLDLALPLMEETLALRKAKLGADHPATLTSMGNLALGYNVAGKLDLALPLYKEALTLMKAKVGADHPATLGIMNNLATGYKSAGKLDLALPLMEETLALRKAKLGADHPDTLTSMSNLAVSHGDAGKHDLALPLLEETLTLMKAKLGADHPDTLRIMHNLAMGYKAAGKLDLALPLHEETVTLMKAKLGLDHPNTLNAMSQLAVGYWSIKRLDKSVPLFEQVLRMFERTLGRDHPKTLVAVGNLGVNYKDAGRFPEAIPLLEAAYRASKTHPGLAFVAYQLLDAYGKSGLAVEAGPLLREVIDTTRRQLPKDSPQLAALLAPCGLALVEAKAFTEAEPLLRECLAIREKTQPDGWTTFNTQSRLGAALLGQKKYADAEPLLLKGYEGLKQRETTIPPQRNTRIPEAIDRLIELATSTNKPDDAKKWRAERAKYPEVAPMPRPVAK